MLTFLTGRQLILTTLRKELFSIRPSLVSFKRAVLGLVTTDSARAFSTRCDLLGAVSNNYIDRRILITTPWLITVIAISYADL